MADEHKFWLMPKTKRKYKIRKTKEKKTEKIGKARKIYIALKLKSYTFLQANVVGIRPRVRCYV